MAGHDGEERGAAGGVRVALPKGFGFLLLRDFFHTGQSNASALVTVFFVHREVLFLYPF